MARFIQSLIRRIRGRSAMMALVGSVLLPGSTSGTEFIRGDADGNEKIELNDAIVLNSHIHGKEIECKDAADVNDDGKIDAQDSLYLLNYIYRGGPQPLHPFPKKGIDISSDSFGCMGEPDLLENAVSLTQNDFTEQGILLISEGSEEKPLRYFLGGNIKVMGSGVEIRGGKHIIFDGRGHVLEYALDQTGIGIQIQDCENVSILHLILRNSRNGPLVDGIKGIEVKGSRNITLEKLVVEQNGFRGIGIDIEGNTLDEEESNHVLQNNDLRFQVEEGNALQISASRNNRIISNRIQQKGARKNYGIVLRNRSDQNFIMNNSVITEGVEGSALYIDQSYMNRFQDNLFVAGSREDASASWHTPALQLLNSLDNYFLENTFISFGDETPTVYLVIPEATTKEMMNRFVDAVVLAEGIRSPGLEAKLLGESQTMFTDGSIKARQWYDIEVKDPDSHGTLELYSVDTNKKFRLGQSNATLKCYWNLSFFVLDNKGPIQASLNIRYWGGEELPSYSTDTEGKFMKEILTEERHKGRIKENYPLQIEISKKGYHTERIMIKEIESDLEQVCNLR